MKSNGLLLDAFSRIRDIVETTLVGLDDESLTARPAGNGNSIAWLIWHLARVEDVQVADVAGRDEACFGQYFVGRFSLPLRPRDTGYGHSSDQVGAVRAPAELLLEYYDAVHRQTVEFVETLVDEDLDRVVDTRWNPPVTLGVRLVSTIADCLQHAGQAAYAKGLQRTPGE
jgi:uncharacterized damage-inducible protein DinB